ncbi:gamma-glutamyl-gamma-aminobutyrate hydrolase family protein [Mycolicibacterium sp.]|uniref:gamma-glutamyl-gamma-aminobutyrate hydrolase family protein n=1 Tax=Mycolicibacterium sp. TaxID=2320850 RepID=UPI0037C6E189
MKPLIGITGRRAAASAWLGRDPRFAESLIDCYFVAYAQHLALAGAEPVYLPFLSDPNGILDHLDGVVIAGGQDIDPTFWTDADAGDRDPRRDSNPRLNLNAYDPERDASEIALARATLDRDIPLLGVCRGHQVLNVALGGTLIPQLQTTDVQHDSAASAPSTGDREHVVHFCPDSLAAELYGSRAVRNSWHHQAVDRCGDGVVVTGRTPDGVCEAIEIPGRRVLGVQWHPELHTEPDPAFAWLAEAARATEARQ